jgi:hypothetical protein
MKLVEIEHAISRRRARVNASAVPHWLTLGWRLPSDDPPPQNAQQEAPAPAPEPVAMAEKLHVRDALTQESDVTAPRQSSEDDESVSEQGEE